MSQPKRKLYILDVADFCGLEAEEIEQLMENGLLNETQDSEENFLAEEDFELLHRVKRLKNTFGVNLAGIEVIIHMREQILYLQQELRNLQNAYKQGAKNALSD